MIISEADVKKVAELAKLDVAGEEAKFAKMFNETLEKVEILKELDTSKVSETFQVTGLKNIYLDPKTNTTLTQEEALANGSNVINHLFATKAVFER